MKRTFVFAVIVVWMSTDVSWAAYEWFTNPANGHKYALTAHGSWSDCEAEAISAGGHLVTVNDQAECDWLVDTDSNPFGLQYSRDHYGEWYYNLVWIGLAYIGGDKTLPSSWEWQNGEPVVFWNPSPEAFLPKFIDGTHMYINGSDPGRSYTGQWAFHSREDLIPEYHLRGVIEVIPEPTTISLLAIGVIALIRNRRS